MKSFKRVASAVLGMGDGRKLHGPYHGIRR